MMRRSISVGSLRAQMRRRANLLVRGWAICVLTWTAGCSVDNKVSLSPDAPPGSGTDDARPAHADGLILVLPEPRFTDGGVVCPPLTCGTGASRYCGDLTDNCGQVVHCGACTDASVCLAGCSVPGGDYCGTIGDGCGGTLVCPSTCPKAGWTCGTDNICKGDPIVCPPATCLASSGDRYCGTIGDGCGHTIECGNDCLPGWDCVSNVCVASSPTVCPPLTCETASGDHYCGISGNGCGGTLDCTNACPTGWTCGTDGICKAVPPACTQAACTTASGNQYCGTIGNGCGGTLNCGQTCPLGWTCQNSMCVGAPPYCTPTATCDTAGGGRYCGKVGDGCGSTLNCPATCLQPGWVCENRLCIGPPDVCKKITCATDSGDHYCGMVGDNCGGSLNCANTCPPGWTCGTYNICKGVPPFCSLLTCTTTSGDHYCGTVGNGCGGSLPCGNDCPAGWICGADHICKGGAGCATVTCDALNGDHYCGTIGDTCGGSLECGATCPKVGWKCDHNICKGDLTTCTPLTCVASSADNYCGAIGDGCGGTLDCGPTCPKSGWLCDSGLCKGGPDCMAKTCTTATGDQYCGDIGDGCGSTVHCGTTCTKANWACQDGLCKAAPGSGCLPLSCLTANGDQYCGDLGDACGGTVKCPATCTKTGWVCDGGLCKGPIGVCTPLTCKPAGGGQYCGTVGDACGNPLPCGADCSASGSNWVCDSKNVCVGGPDCVKVSCNNASGVQQYCGDIGDNCGGTLSCPATCPAGTTCNSNHVCGCGNLCLRQVACPGGATTSISGTVYDPAGLNPLYNVIVSIPNAPLDPIATGATCATCDAQVSGQPIASALTDATGHFVLNNVPWGTSFPLVMQLGKWRRQVTIPSSMVTHQCADNLMVDNPPDGGTLPDRLLRLPRNIHDGDNNGQYTSIPKIAIAAGHAQNPDKTTDERLQCLLRRIGVDASEFTLPSSSAGTVRLYNQSTSSDTCNQVTGSTGTYPDATTNLWDSQAHLNQYDVILLNCGGAQVDPTSTAGRAFIPNPTAVNLMKAYVNAGGRVFAEHFHWAWIKSFTGYPSTFGDVATWNTGTDVIGSTARDTLIDQSFPKGIAFASWLSNVGASTAPGHLALSSSVKYTAIDQINPPSQRWIYEPANVAAPTGPAVYTHYFSFNTPIGAAAAAQCGKFVYTALHVTDAATTDFPGDPDTSAGNVFPGCCSIRTGLSPQEKALEFMIFDLSGCVTTIKLPPPPPGRGPAAGCRA